MEFKKTYWPTGVAKKGHFFLIGSPTGIVLVTEGFSTGASVHQATGFPVAVAFDANNLTPVVEALQKRYPRIKIIICADDDAFSKCSHCKEPVNVNQSADCPACKKPHGKKNTGVEAANNALLSSPRSYDITVLTPKFKDRAANFERFCNNKGKLGDFNDLYLIDGLHTVRTQIEYAKDQKEWGGESQQGAKSKEGEGDDDKIGNITHFQELLDDYSYVYGSKSSFFDHRRNYLVHESDIRKLCVHRQIYQQWQECHDKKTVEVKNVGYDPGGDDPKITCNLFNEKNMRRPIKGSIEKTLELVDFLCSKEPQTKDWLLKWLAFPLQNPGAKMKQAVVMRGGQGTGKGLFFEAILKIYGEHGVLINQDAINDKHNDFISGKSFALASEAVSASDDYSVKNKIKGLITDSPIRINPKNVCSHYETNHLNMVFISNEIIPVLLEFDDRRMEVICTPPKREKQFYRDVAYELANGGIEALYYYLLNLPLDGFNEDTETDGTIARGDLITVSIPSSQQFYSEWTAGEIDGLESSICTRQQLYDVFRIWCKRSGINWYCSIHNFTNEMVNQGCTKKSRVQVLSVTRKTYTFLIPPNAKEPNPGESMSGFFGGCKDAFDDQIECYKNS